MTIVKISPRTLAGVFKTLEDLAYDCDSNRSLFRGHRDAKWRVASTLSRHRPFAFSPGLSDDLHTMIAHFLVRLKSIGMDIPFDVNDRRARLEYARHAGIPSPLIDFSLSPNIALFFAFNGVKSIYAKKTDHAAVYCLNIAELANVWAKRQPGAYERERDNFLDDPPAFDYEYPTGLLK